MTHMRFLRCHRIYHRLKSLVISVCAHVVPSVKSFTLVDLPLFSHCGIASVYGETWKNKRNNSDGQYVKSLLTIIELICVNCCFAGQSPNMTCQCDVV